MGEQTAAAVSDDGGQPAAGGRPPETGRPDGPASRWVRVLLVGSLVLNLLFIGAVAGMAVGHWGRGDGRPGGPDPGFGPFTDALTREDRQALKRELARKVPDMRRMRAEMDGDMAAVAATLRRDPFDAAALRAALAQMRGRFQSRMEIGVDLLVGRLTEMSPDERRAFADRLEAGPRHGGPKGP